MNPVGAFALSWTWLCKTLTFWQWYISKIINATSCLIILMTDISCVLKKPTPLSNIEVFDRFNHIFQSCKAVNQLIKSFRKPRPLWFPTSANEYIVQTEIIWSVVTYVLVKEKILVSFKLKVGWSSSN